MKRIAWVSSAAVIAAGLGFAIERSPLLSIADSASAGEEAAPTRIDVEADLAAVIAAPLEGPYSPDGRPFADIRVATAKPFEASGDALSDDLMLASGSIVGSGDMTVAFLPGRGRASAEVYLAELASGALGETPASAGFWPQWRSAYFREDPRVGTVEDALGRPVAPELLSEALGKADYVLLGETHDNPDHHRLQARMVERLGESGRRPSLVLEMISRDQEGELAALRAETAPASSYGTRLRWEERGWPAYEFYEPVVAAALGSDMPIHAGDLDPTLRRAIAEKGLDALPKTKRADWHLDAAAEPADIAAAASEVRAAHCGLMPDAAIPRMVAVQRARDAALADAMRSARDGGPVILIAGAGHVRNDRAVPKYLRAAEPDARIVSVMLTEVSGEGAGRLASVDISEAQDSVPFDYKLFTPRADVSDRCAALKEEMERR